VGKFLNEAAFADTETESYQEDILEKTTKYCEIAVTLVNGARITGRFHIESRTSSTVRPSDALREVREGLLLLTDVTVHAPPEPRSIPALMIPFSSIAWVEPPPARWMNRPAT
jgi:hypothetical protein